ncbi:hypothetical protein KY359_06580 [Candidatus Woesearchaeota archaeon]|nr:hypothetical protein [Candidatus Woesearchaeota archaeon]
MCLSECANYITLFSPPFLLLGILGFGFALFDTYVLKKKVLKTEKILKIALIVCGLILLIGVAGFALAEKGCSYYDDIILCKYLGLFCKLC